MKAAKGSISRGLEAVDGVEGDEVGEKAGEEGVDDVGEEERELLAGVGEDIFVQVCI